jgi:hypothetical protein
VKTPEELAEEYGKSEWPIVSNDCDRIGRDNSIEGFLAGYQAAKDQVADADKVMNSPKKLDSWISVKERLPEVNTWCLWLYPTGPEVNQYEGKLDDGTLLFHRSWYDFDDTDVTHWTPLPEPPKGEGSAE